MRQGFSKYHSYVDFKSGYTSLKTGCNVSADMARGCGPGARAPGSGQAPRAKGPGARGQGPRSRDWDQGPVDMGHGPGVRGGLVHRTLALALAGP